MLKKTIVFSCLILISLSSFLFGEGNSSSLSINIISRNLHNGLGKESDAMILKEEMEKLGHQVYFFDINKVNNIRRSNINIFLAQFKSEWFKQAKFNWFIPNAEYCEASAGDLLKFDLVLCKTKESLRIFEPLCKEVFYLGFTSCCHYDPEVSKNFSMHLHLAGGSVMKGTKQVLKCWEYQRGLHKLILIKHKDNETRVPSNVTLIDHFLPYDELVSIQNKCGIHLCPSRTEGFGHYIMEGMSTGAVIVTTDAPPMNEFINDERCLVKYLSTSKQKYATLYEVDYRDLAIKIERLQKLSRLELEKIGEANRENYLKRNDEFKQNLHTLMSTFSIKTRN